MNPEAEFCAKDIRRSAMNLLARREHGFDELVRKLRQYYPADEITPQIETLREEGLQDDGRFVESYINARSQRGYGPIRLKMELQQRGVSGDLLEQYLFEDDEDWYIMAMDIRVRKFGPALPSDYKQRVKQMRYLMQRGFNNNQINRCLHKKY